MECGLHVDDDNNDADVVYMPLLSNAAALRNNAVHLFVSLSTAWNAYAKTRFSQKTKQFITFTVSIDEWRPMVNLSPTLAFQRNQSWIPTMTVNQQSAK